MMKKFIHLIIPNIVTWDPKYSSIHRVIGALELPTSINVKLQKVVHETNESSW